MDNSSKKAGNNRKNIRIIIINFLVYFTVFKKTSSAQFDVLVKELEKNPDLAKGAPMFGASKSLVELQWNELANKLNAHGPPQRTATEWKKIWADLKSRTKKKIAENASSMHATGGGPFRLSPLTDLEKAIDRILLVSKAATPSGTVLGVRQVVVRSEPELDQSPQPPSPEELLPIVVTTPVRTAALIGVVTPTRQQSTTPKRHIAAASAPQSSRKRTFQELIAESAKEQASAAKIQAEAAQKMAEAAMIQAESTRSIAETLKELLEITIRKAQAIESLQDKFV